MGAVLGQVRLWVSKFYRPAADSGVVEGGASNSLVQPGRWMVPHPRGGNGIGSNHVTL